MTLNVGFIPWDSKTPAIPTVVTEWINNAAGQQRSNTAQERADGRPIPEGGRNNALASLAGSMRRRGMSERAITAALTEVNVEQCVPPMHSDDVRRIAQSVCRYEADDPVIRLFEKGHKDPVYDDTGHLQHRLQVATLKALVETESQGYDSLLGPYIIRGLRTLIGAGTGEGKTTLLMHMLKATVMGTGFLGEIGHGPDENGRSPKVLIIDAEQSLPDIQRLAAETGLQESEDILYISAPDGLDLAEGSHDALEVEEIMEEHKPDILVIDPLYKVARIDSNDEREAVNLMRLFDRWRTDPLYSYGGKGFAFVMPVHTRKGLKTQQGGQPSMDDIFGSGAFSRGAEIILGLRRPGPGFARMYVWKHRPGFVDAGVHYDMTFERSTGFHLQHRDNAQTIPEQVMHHLALHTEGLVIEDIMELVGRTKDSIRHALRELSGRVKTEKIPGTRGRLLYKAIMADEGDLEHWQSLVAMEDDPE